MPRAHSLKGASFIPIVAALNLAPSSACPYLSVRYPMLRHFLSYAFLLPVMSLAQANPNPYASPTPTAPNPLKPPMTAPVEVQPSTPRKNHPLTSVRVQPTAESRIRWVVVPTGERSANTGQLTCAGWAQSVGLPNILEQFGPFHGAIASQDAWEEFGDAKFYWNNSAQAMLIPFASRWDIPIWMDGASDNPAPTWSALFQWSFAVGGNATLVVAWDDSTLPDFLTGWVDGLIKAKTLDGLQGLSWKQKMASWPKSEPHVGLMEYTIKNGTLQNFSWRFVKTKVSGAGFSGCSK